MVISFLLHVQVHMVFTDWSDQIRYVKLKKYDISQNEEEA